MIRKPKKYSKEKQEASLVEDVVAKDAAEDRDEYQRLTGTVSPSDEGEEAHSKEGHQS